MNKLLLAVVVSVAVTSTPAFAHHPAADNENLPDGTWEMIDANLLAADSPHYYMTDDDMGSDSAGSDGMSQTGDADLQRIEGGEQASEQSKESAGQDDDDVDDSEAGSQPPYGNGNQYQQASSLVDPDTSIALSNEEAADLEYMREEEKLARDVYLKLYDTWGSRIFKNIANAEQNHMDRVKAMLDAYEIADPALAEKGSFADQDLQDLYDYLVAKGEESLMEALKVGLYIEEIDIDDLQTAISQTDNPAIVHLYTTLLNGSYSHLRAFTSQLANLGLDYEPELLTDEELESILDGEELSPEFIPAAAVDKNLNAWGTRSRFSYTMAGRSGNRGNNAEFGQGDRVKLAAHIIPDEEDVGEVAESLIVAQYESEKGEQATLMRTRNSWALWDGDIETLTSADERKLRAVQEIKVFEGELTGAPGQFTIFVAYRLKDGRIVYSGKPMGFRVE